ncbi:sigma-54-dependent transcriptional regulator [Corallococcus macrosporus]|uniref:Sigma-54 dependent DNA-binding response regulator n=1 Tax=Myxococcus fulvus (strain ATCC BAA-855 / HW-1) TaxID=483219 RepID=F8CKE7_MYXFH|nr:sigma-54 dependent transcriptional regulator [Corallococcus macrosporus]AEI67703.1 sigma-54 dependent DNA-binding response regulator [Corallococcus macrosporus]
MARILVADDEEGVRSFLAEALEYEGHSVTTAADGEEAARLMARQGVDLLLTDLRMPGMDGLTLLRKVREEQPDVEVVVLTAVGTVESAVAAMKAGAFDYLLKPVGSPAELRLTVARALERRALLNWKTEARQSAGDVELSWGAPAMAPVVEALRKVAPTQATVLLVGESGTGKEVTARALHQWSERADGPFVAVNCAALTETLLESELFGHEKGAFTGAVAQRRGRVELAQGGTFFLDEVGELKAELQAKLLRVLQERRFERVGGTRTLEADVRWVAATNRDLKAMMARGEFREDLYHRLAVFPIRLPSLRERREDLRPLAALLLRRIGDELGRPGLRLSPEAVARLEAFAWPGNVRELRNALERAAILADGPVVEPRHLWLDPTGAGGTAAEASTSEGGRLPDLTLEELERRAIEQAIADEAGNRKRAAQRLGIGLRTLYDKLRRYESP